MDVLLPQSAWAESPHFANMGIAVITDNSGVRHFIPIPPESGNHIGDLADELAQIAGIPPERVDTPMLDSGIESDRRRNSEKRHVIVELSCLAVMLETGEPLPRILPFIMSSAEQISDGDLDSVLETHVLPKILEKIKILKEYVNTERTLDRLNQQLAIFATLTERDEELRQKSLERKRKIVEEHGAKIRLILSTMGHPGSGKSALAKALGLSLQALQRLGLQTKGSSSDLSPYEVLWKILDMYGPDPADGVAGIPMNESAGLNKQKSRYTENEIPRPLASTLLEHLSQRPDVDPVDAAAGALYGYSIPDILESPQILAEPGIVVLDSSPATTKAQYQTSDMHPDMLFAPFRLLGRVDGVLLTERLSDESWGIVSRWTDPQSCALLDLNYEQIIQLVDSAADSPRNPMKSPATYEIVEEILGVVFSQIYRTSVDQTNRHLRDLLNHIGSHRYILGRYLNREDLAMFLSSCRACGGYASPLAIHPSVEEYLCMLDETAEELKPFELRLDDHVQDLAQSLIEEEASDTNTQHINMILSSVKRMEDLSGLPETDAGNTVLSLILSDILDTHLHSRDATVSSVLQEKLDRTLRQLRQLPIFSDPNYPGFSHENRDMLLGIHTLQDVAHAIEGEKTSAELHQHLLYWFGASHRLYQRILSLNEEKIEEIPVATQQVLHVLETESRIHGGIVLVEPRAGQDTIVHDAGDPHTSRPVDARAGIFGDRRPRTLIVVGRRETWYQNIDIPTDSGIGSELRASLMSAKSFEDLMALPPRIQLRLRTYFPDPTAQPVL